ncbi:hypothetical protein [Streptacidiphilus fuscans]|uniref:Uncharacterized protein n=1 Tax=Streptacidiphilus fuscans TaxID=2789292 RepID=A0A931AVV1_9ACTN|nr:hypothetical protein [Streptacidiphilus fuscans]MBF9066415.1 hypothetical protein [Streptacidiphilus fuscans]
MNPWLRYTLRLLSMPMATMTGYLLSCLTVTHDFTVSRLCIYGALGLPAGLIASRRRYNQDHAARRVGQ